jgi:hypothetical protein
MRANVPFGSGRAATKYPTVNGPFSTIAADTCFGWFMLYAMSPSAVAASTSTAMIERRNADDMSESFA